MRRLLLIIILIGFIVSGVAYADRYSKEDKRKQKAIGAFILKKIIGPIKAVSVKVYKKAIKPAGDKFNEIVYQLPGKTLDRVSTTFEGELNKNSKNNKVYHQQKGTKYKCPECEELKRFTERMEKKRVEALRKYNRPIFKKSKPNKHSGVTITKGGGYIMGQ